ncbi:MAG: conjugal transfer protein TraI, partial [Nitrobacter vulgaris]|nr:conjugal transfer protein TraI [Nitrobacter vulgaris]
MTGTDQANPSSNEASRPQQPEKIAETLRLRPDQPQVTRLSRKVLAGVTALAFSIICGAVLWSLQDRSKQGPAREELHSTDRHNVADELKSLPKDYAG